MKKSGLNDQKMVGMPKKIFPDRHVCEVGNRSWYTIEGINLQWCTLQSSRTKNIEMHKCLLNI